MAMADPSPGYDRVRAMSKDKSSAAAPAATPSPAAASQADAPRPTPAAGPGRIQPAPEPAFDDPHLVGDEGRETLNVVIHHGSLRRDGETFVPGDTLALPVDEAKRFEALGVVKLLRRPA